MKKKIIYISIVIVSMLFSFFLEKYLSSRTNKELENDLKIATDKLANVEKRNEELVQLSEQQKTIIETLEIENQNSTENIRVIKEINISTAEKLNDLESSANSTMSSLNKLKENNQILREYFNSILSVTEEE